MTISGHFEQMFRTKGRTLDLQPMLIRDQASKPQTKLNQYLFTGRLGRGSNSTVHLAIDTNTGKQVAAKAIRLQGSSNTAALQREIRNMRRLHHKNIVHLIEVLYRKDTQTAYLIMEYASGSLKGKILTEAQIRSVFAQTVAALLYLHSQDMIHQDVKPSNILLFEGGRVKLADFGIGHSFASAETVIGSPAYQAPEFLEDGRRNPAKEDVWSLGVSIFECLSGHLPFFGQSVYEIVADTQRKVRIPEGASREISDLLERMLCPDPERRISMEEVAKHPFFEGVAEPLLNLDAPLLKTKDSSAQIDVFADICDEDYVFATQLVSGARSWPGLRRQVCAFC
jgi:serine/threonine-protein kinase 11